MEMIENLNKLAFSPYGQILRESTRQDCFPQGAEWERRREVFGTNETYYYHANSELYLKAHEGMTVLLLRKKGVLAAFYLDKPVCLPAETEYALLPYAQECSVELCHVRGKPPECLEHCDHQQGLKIADSIHLKEVYTLFYQEGEPGFLFKGEQHAAFELTYVDRGQLTCMVDGKSHLLKQGQMMIFGPNQWHMQYTDLETTARFLTVSFDMESDMELPLQDRVFDLSSTEAVYLKQLLREPEIRDIYSNDMIRGNLKLLLLSILRSMGDRRKRLKTPTAMRNEGAIVGRALQYVADHVYERMSVETVAKETGVSASHLTALFHRQMNLSPGEYIRRVKLEESKSLIRKGQMNFSQIAAALCYSTIHHYSRQFKDHFGITPTEYAKSLIK